MSSGVGGQIWAPNVESLDQLVLILSGTLTSNSSIRVQATEALEKAKSEIDFDNYLLHILINGTNLEPQVRASAGLLLKNDISKNFSKKSNELKTHILNEIIKGLVDQQSLVRNITGNVITTLFSIYGVEQWPQLLPNLMELAKGAGNSVESQEGAMSCLSKICEDSARLLDVDYNGERPLNFMIPIFIQLMENQNSKIRSSAIFCINQFLLIRTQSILVYLDEYMSRLFTLSTDEDAKVRTNICSAFTNILDARPDKLMPHLDGVINYSIHSVQDNNEDVAVEACEFLLGLATSEIPSDIIKPKLDLIIPVLLTKMVYSEMDVFLMANEDEKDDENVEDKDEDIKPTNAKSKDAHKVTKKSTTQQQQQSQQQQQQQSHDSDSDDDDDDDDEDDDDDDDSFDWNLRKCSAATLDVLATSYSDEVLNIALPIITERIVSPEWPVREASILALGAIAEGCIERASSQLPALIPFLVERLKDDETRVRQITCWTLGRYSSWVCNEAEIGGSYGNYFAPTFQSIIDCALDRKKVVQESACSALADFIDNADSTLISSFIEPLLHHFQLYFRKYQRKNLVILYDTVQTFVDKIGDKLKLKQEYIDILLPPLIEKWQFLSDDDKNLWPLLECLSSVAAALGESFAPYAIPIYSRAFSILANCLRQEKMCNTDPNIDPPEKDFIVTSIDLIDGLIQGLKQHSGELIQQHDIENTVPALPDSKQEASTSSTSSQIIPTTSTTTTSSSSQGNAKLMSLLIQCFDDVSDDVRQSAYALLGDLSIYLIEPIVLPYLHEVMISIGTEITNRTFESCAACNNAVWALGEISLRISNETMSNYLDNFMNILVPLLLSTDVEQTVLENTCITIGRIGSNNAGLMGKYLDKILLTWCSHMQYLDENDEKETAFIGMCNILTMNPESINLNDSNMVKALSTFIECIAIYENPSDGLANMFHVLLTGFKNGFGEQLWQQMINSEPDSFVPGVLQVRYGV